MSSSPLTRRELLRRTGAAASVMALGVSQLAAMRHLVGGLGSLSLIYESVYLKGGDPETFFKQMTLSNDHNQNWLVPHVGRLAEGLPDEPLYQPVRQAADGWVSAMQSLTENAPQGDLTRAPRLAQRDYKLACMRLEHALQSADPELEVMRLEHQSELDESLERVQRYTRARHRKRAAAGKDQPQEPEAPASNESPPAETQHAASSHADYSEDSLTVFRRMNQAIEFGATGENALENRISNRLGLDPARKQEARYCKY